MHRLLILGGLALLMLSLLFAPRAALSQSPYPLDKCRYGAFSTEEDFMMTTGEPYDGDRYISDGDLLNLTGEVCARNKDLLVALNPTGGLMPDLGLDAVHIIDFPSHLVAFSTELDSPYRNFGAGDILFTNGGVIPNRALVTQFGIPNDVGLDGLQLFGKPDDLIAFANRVREANPSAWDQGLLQTLMRSFSVDIWFSIEGTHQGRQILILDGDILSPTGVVIAHNSNLLPPSVPAGLPNRGVDFGLDAIAGPRYVSEALNRILFSTEILHRGDPSFTDGAVIKYGNGVERTNWQLIQPFGPKADFLGLDALWLLYDETPLPEPSIQTMCGDSRPASDFDGGYVPVGGPGTGLYRENPGGGYPDGRPRRPCGDSVPIGGNEGGATVTKFRVAYRNAGALRPAFGSSGGVRTTWLIKTPRPWWPFDCNFFGSTLSTDVNGWMDAAAYRGAKSGATTGGCTNDHLRLGVWDSTTAPDPNGHYVLWLEWQQGATPYQEPFDHHLQLDNTLPSIPAYPNGLQIRLPDGSTVLPACNLDNPVSGNIYQVWGQFSDAYYSHFTLWLGGGDPPASAGFGPHNYWDPNDGTVGVKNTDRNGTLPVGLKRLRDIDMSVALGASFKRCCYLLELKVYDASIRHSFNGVNAGGYTPYSSTFVTFAAAP